MNRQLLAVHAETQIDGKGTTPDVSIPWSFENA